MGELSKAIIGEVGELVGAGFQELKLAGESLGLYESDLKRAYRRRNALDELRPEVDSLLGDIESRYSSRPELWEKQFEKQRQITELFELAYQKQLRVIEAGKPQIPTEAPEEEFGEPVRSEMLGGLDVTDVTLPQRQQLPTQDTLPSSTDVAPTGRLEARAQTGQILQAEAPGILDRLVSIKDRFDKGSEQGVVNTMNAMAQLPRVAGNMGMLAPFSRLPLEERLRLSQEIGSTLSDKISTTVESYRPNVWYDESRRGLKKIEGLSDIKSAEDVAQVIAENAPLMATLMFSFIMNPVAGTALMFGVEGGDAAQMMDEMEKETGIEISPENKFLTTIAVGGINAALERTGMKQVLSGVLNPYRSRIVSAMIGAGAEGSTEFLQEWTQILVEAGVKDDPKLKDLDIGKKFQIFWEELGKKENWDRSGLSGFVGTIFGVGAGPGATAERAALERAEEGEFKTERERVAEERVGKERRVVQRAGREGRKAEEAAERLEVVEAAKKKKKAAEVTPEETVTQNEAMVKIVSDSEKVFRPIKETGDALLMGATEITAEDAPKIRAEIEKLAQFVRGIPFSEETFNDKFKVQIRKQLLLEALSAFEGKHLNYEADTGWKEGELDEYTKETIAKARGEEYAAPVRGDEGQVLPGIEAQIPEGKAPVRKEEGREDLQRAAPGEPGLPREPQEVIPMDGWRTHLIKARTYAKELGIDTIDPEGLTAVWTNEDALVKFIDDFLEYTAKPAEEGKYFTKKEIEIVDFYVKEGRSFKEIHAGLNVENPHSENDTQELIELSIQQQARGKTLREILKIYGNQPKLGRRTSTKVIEQQYSTPAPLAWIMGKLAGIDKADTYYDPTAGTGMLSVAGDPALFYANEIDPKRADLLRTITKNVTTFDAVEHVTPAKFDAIVMNPPFGKLDKAKSAQPGDYKITKLEHWIAVQGLSSMEDNGRATILLGGNSFKTNFGKETDRLSDTDWIFFNWLYSNFNVVSHINIPGKLYEKQGTSYQTRLVVIDGKKKSDLGAPGKEGIKNPQTWDELIKIYEEIQNVLRTEPGERAGGRKRPGGEITPGAGEPVGVPGGVPGEIAGVTPTGLGVGEGEPIPVPGGIGPAGEPGGISRVPIEPGPVQPPARKPGIQKGKPVEPKGVGAGVPAGAPAGPTQSLIDTNKNYGADNKLVSRDRASELKAQLSAKLAGPKAQAAGEGAASFDPEIFSLGTELAAFHIEAGNRTFGDFSRAMIMDLGETVVPYLKSFYMGARNFPGMSTKGTNTEQEVERFVELGKLDQLVPTITPEPVTTVKEKAIKLEEGQIPSFLKSKGLPLTTVMPRNIFSHVEESLNRIEEEFGSIDKYVEDKLQFQEYSSMAMSEAFAAEQVDDIAMAIYQMDKGNGMIIGDMAGVGKGRVAAALLHYGRLQRNETGSGIPIFVTKSASPLFTALWNDFENIGITDIKPFILNAPAPGRDSNMYNLDGSLAHRALSSDKRSKMLKDMTENPAILNEFDFIAMTYSQASREESAAQRAIQGVAINGYLIMDESHNAAGDESNTGLYFQDLISRAKGTTFLSATFAKFPENMALYHNTILRAYEPDDLVEAMKAGGVPLQEIVATALAKGGQLTRHERSYDGVTFDPIELTENYANDKRRADAVTEILRDISALDKQIGAIVKKVEKDLAFGGGRTRIPKNLRDSASKTQFGSVVHNIVTQLMLAVKTDSAIERAIYWHKQGKKPVITMMNTMGTALTDFVLDEDLAMGDPIDYSFSDVLDRSLENQLYYKIKSRYGAITKEPIDWESDNILRPMVERIKEKIAAETIDLSGSPFDIMRDRLQAAGIKMGEISGRDLKIDYSDEANPTIQTREKEEKDKRVVLSQFNDGTLDGLLVNRSASTGLSAHASKEFKDQRPRIMITVQAELNINEMVQMFGRIFRTGQVELPAYELLFTGLPLEIRPAAILMNKMKSLNANVSATQTSGTSFDVTDFMNIYGDAVIREMIRTMSPEEQLVAFGKVPFIDSDNTDLSNLTAKKVTGWLSIAPINVQERFLGELDATYTELIATLTAQGENKLITQEFDYQSETISQIKAFAGSDQTNPLTADSFIETMEVNVLKKPMKRADVKKAIGDKAGRTFIDDFLLDLDDRKNKYYEPKFDALQKRIEAIEDPYSKEAVELRDRQTELKDEASEKALVISNVLEGMEIGFGYKLEEKEYDDESHSIRTKVYTGVLTNVTAKKTGSPLSFSNIILQFATNDPARHRIHVPLSKYMMHEIGQNKNNFYRPMDFVQFSEGIPDNWEETQAKTNREEINVWTGNIFAAYTKVADRHDSIIRFTTKDGKIREGIIIRKEAKSNLVSTQDMDIVFDYLKKGKEPILSPEQTEDFKIAWTGDDFKVIVPAAKSTGGQYYTNTKLLNIVDNKEFTQEGKNFVATVQPFNELYLKNHLTSLGFTFAVSRTFIDRADDKRDAPGGSTLADMGGYVKTNESLIEMPEMVEIAKQLLDGRLPRVKKKLRKAKGMALGQFSHREGQQGSESIKLRADIFKDPDLAAKVLSHEIGHLFDYLPSRTMAHGNILGRMATLNKHMLGWYKAYENATVKEELKELTRIWKPFDPAEDKKYTKYRYSSVELYADAVSVLFNDPSLLQEIAPRFYDGFFEFLERKPSVKSIYNLIQARTKSGRKEIEENRYENIRHMVGEQSEENYLKARRGITPTLDMIGQELYRALSDKNQKIIRNRNKILKAGQYIDPENDPVYWVEELPYVSAQVFQYLRDITNDIKNPAEAVGLSEVDIGHYMFLDRSGTERAQLANPKGIDQSAAESGLDYLREKLGTEKFDVLGRLIETYQDLRDNKIKPFLEQAQMYTDEFMEMMKDNRHYATWQVSHYLEEKYGNRDIEKWFAGGWIYKQIGTLSDIQNPFLATIMKDAALIRAANRKMAAQSIVTHMQEFYNDEIREADKKWNGKFWEFDKPKDDKQGLIMYLHKGKIEGYYVPKDVADTFNRDPYRAWIIIRGIENVYGVLKDVYVGKNPFWAMWNTQRDFRSLLIHLPQTRAFFSFKVTKMLVHLTKRFKDTRLDVYKNQSTPLVRRLYEERSLLIGRHYRSKIESDEREFDRMMESYTVNPAKHKKIVGRLWGGLMNKLEHIGKFSERWLKITGASYLESLGMGGKEFTHMTRVRAGSPDFFRRAHFKRIMDWFFMFSGAGKEGWRQSIEAAKETPFTFAWNLTKYSLIPKLLMHGAKIGALGFVLVKFFPGYDEDDIKDMMENIPDHDMQNYTCIPLGLTENRKTVYLVLPMSFTGQVLSGLMWNVLSQDRDAHISELFDYASGEIPYSSLNPMLSFIIDLITFSSGKNPYDQWRGRYAIPDREFDAGGKYAAEKFGKYELEQMGLGNYYRFPYDDLERNKTEFEELIGIPVLSGFFRRFVRISDRGRTEALYRAADLPRQERAVSNIEMSEKIIEHLNKTKNPNRTDARRLYVRLKKEGMDVGEHFGDRFWPKYMTTAIFRDQPAVIRAFNSVSTNDQKRAVLEKAFPGIKIDEKYVRTFKRDLKKIFK